MQDFLSFYLSGYIEASIRVIVDEGNPELDTETVWCNRSSPDCKGSQTKPGIQWRGKKNRQNWIKKRILYARNFGTGYL